MPVPAVWEVLVLSPHQGTVPWVTPLSRSPGTAASSGCKAWPYCGQQQMASAITAQWGHPTQTTVCWQRWGASRTCGVLGTLTGCGAALPSPEKEQPGQSLACSGCPGRLPGGLPLNWPLPCLVLHAPAAPHPLHVPPAWHPTARGRLHRGAGGSAPELPRP